MNREVGLKQIRDGFIHPDLVQIMNQGASGLFLEERTDVILAHHHVARHRFNRNVLLVVLMDVLQYFLYLRVRRDFPGEA